MATPAVELVTPRTPRVADLAPHDRARALLEIWLSGKAETTVRAYRKDLERWAEWMGRGLDDALAELLGLGPGHANALALSYRGDLVEEELAPSTVNRRLAALRSVVKAARTVGLISWDLDVSGVRARAYRDTRGPGVDGYRAMVAALEEEGDTPRVRRDRALLALLYTMALRRAEAVGLDMVDLELASRRVWIVGKGSREREAVTVPEGTAQLLEAWLEVRGEEPGPVFLSLDRRAGGGRLHLNSATRLVRRLGKAAGLGKVSPHGLRHSGITRALDLTGGDVRKVRALSRHAKLETLMRYDDARRDGAGRVAALLDADA